ncbi:MAG TPA: hypothetical protein VFL51_05580 [Pseudolabrys sp.]|nr:hypothetical protein [Pseudolabrys sp.]
MPRYVFDLNTGREVFRDPDGMELADATAAEAHGAAVVREIIRNNKAQTSAWRLQIHTGEREPCFEILFASVDDSIRHLPLKVQALVRQGSSTTASLMETFQAVQLTLLRAKAAIARSRKHPYIAASDGVRI